MANKQGCLNCRSSEFLGVECAWPALRCVASAEIRMRPYTVWRRRVLMAVTALILLFGTWQVGQAAYIHAKAQLAQLLIEQAWKKTLAGDNQVRPWSWADTWPVARLSVPARDIELYVLAGSSDRTIAFGPGHVFGTPLPGESGNSVIGAHRDTHFAFLQWLEDGEEIEVQDARGVDLRYRVAYSKVVDKTDVSVMSARTDGDRLTLVTCYPFNALTSGGRLRYVVVAQPVPTEKSYGFSS